MLYLIVQIAFLLLIAVTAGLGVGWWIRSFIGTHHPAQDALDDPFDARFRLEQCHRDNAALGRDLKDVGERADKLQSRLDHIENLDTTSLEQQEAYEIRIQALLEDLQLRDDTIAGLEHELAAYRR